MHVKDYNDRVEMLENKARRAKMRIDFIKMSDKTYRHFRSMLDYFPRMDGLSNGYGSIRGNRIVIDNDLPMYRIDSEYMENANV